MRTVARKVAEWIGRLGEVWVEGQIAQLSRRGSATVFLTLRDPAADLSVPVTCARDVADRPGLELTEGATQPLIKLMDTLTRFRIKGIGLALDDFGTGYSSLLQLRQLPFTEVKIDQAFVADVPSSRDSRLIIQAVTDLAHGLLADLRVEAREVEPAVEVVLLVLQRLREHALADHLGG